MSEKEIAPGCYGESQKEKEQTEDFLLFPGKRIVTEREEKMLQGKEKNSGLCMLKTENLTHEYSRRDVEGNVLAIHPGIDGIDLEVNAGEFIGIIGANGSGKSTLAKHINGLLTPTEGDLWLDGHSSREKENIMTIRQLAGMVFQNPDNQIISNVVEEDVAFGPENLGVPTGQIVKRVRKSLEDVEMSEYAKKSPNRLSGGQKQRVAIAGVLAMKPKCIVLDEATAMLDPKGRESILETVHRLNREEGITIIHITHFMEEVVDAHRIFLMGEGKVRLAGTPGQVFRERETLEKWGMTLPDVVQIANGLRQKGVPLREDILKEEDLLREFSGIITGR